MKPATRTFYAQAVQRAVEQMASRLDEALELGILTRHACLSPFHFHRVFRGVTGEAPMEMVRRLRMERAAWRLKHTDWSVSTIAFDAGFETHEAFTRAFRASFATAPSDFRRRKHPRIEVAALCGIHYRDGEAVPPFVPRESGGQEMDVKIKQVEEQRVAAVRHNGPYNQIDEAFEKLGGIAGPAGLYDDPAVKMVGLYYDDPETTPAEQLRSDAGLVVSKSTKLPGGLGEQRIPAGEYASTLYVGPYESLPDVWGRFMGEWLPSSGYRVADDGLSYELYLNDPSQVPKEELRTELLTAVVRE
ncbi:MAG TPA: AraC family transcriptional regulator [Gemmatimonadaceae bacterium]|jgi:AraC family transcriptional regulator